jgi:putative ABC transport system permease protein
MISAARGATVISWQTLRAHKLRTGLTCLSLALAVLALVVVDAASQVAASALVAESRVTQGIPQTWSVSIPAEPAATSKATRAQAITDTILAASGGSCALIATGNGHLAGVDVSVVAMEGDLRNIRPFRVTSGHWLSLGSSSRSPEVVLGRGAASKLGTGDARLSFPGTSRSITVRVVGTVDDASTNTLIYMSLADLMPLVDLTPETWPMELLDHAGPDQTDEPKIAMTDALAVVDLPTQAPRRLDDLGAATDSLATVRLTFLVVAAVALLVGTLGILNIGLVSLHERVEEIALRRATGAFAVQIAASVVIESVIASVIAAIVAVVVALVALPLITQTLFADLPTAVDVSFPYQTAILGIVAAALAGFAGGIVPAVRAARMEIADVMRA